MAENNKNTKTVAAVGIAALAAAAAAGAYYFYGSSDAKQHRKKLKGWMVKAKGEVLEQLEGMKEVTKDTYDKVVDEVMTRYKDVKNIPAPQLMALGRELHGHWKAISGSIQSKKPARKTAPKTSKKPASKK